MRNINKNSTWLSLTLITLLLLIIGLYAIGFDFGEGTKTLKDIGTAYKAEGAAGYIRSTYALFVSALVFNSVAICLVIIKWVLDELNIKTKLASKYWDFVFLGIIILAAILMIAGASLYINREVSVNSKTANSGAAAGFFILVILTIPLNIIPIFMSNEDDEPKQSTENVPVEVHEEVVIEVGPDPQQQP